MSKYDDDNNEITYTVNEAGNLPSSYSSQVTGNITDGYTITNTLETASLTLNKVVKADSSIDTSGMTFTFYVVGNNGELENVTSVSDGTNDYSVNGGVATVTVPADGSVTLVNLPVGTYTVYETDGTTITTTYNSTTYTWTISGDNNEEVKVEADGEAEATITNTITYTGSLVLTKTWDDSSNLYDTRPESITFTLTGYVYDSESGEYALAGDDYVYTCTTTGDDTDSWIINATGVEFYDADGNIITYVVTEVLTWSTGATTYTYTATYTSEDTIYLKDTVLDETEYEYGTDYGTITPYYSRNITINNAVATTTVTINKVVLAADGTTLTTADNQDNFRFVLYTYVDGTAVQIGEAQTISAGGTAEWTRVPQNTELYLTEVLVGTHTHSYDTTVTLNGTELDVTEDYGYIESISAYAKTHTVTFTLTGDGTIEITVTNQEEEVSVDLSALLKGSKTLKIADGAELESELEFTYSVYEGQTGTNTLVATGTATTSSTNTTSVINWTILDEDAFTYSEVGTYTYTIVEDVSSTGGVVYDSTRYTLNITVTQDSRGGGLVATATMTKNVENSDGTRTTSIVYSDMGYEDSIVVGVVDTENSSTEISDDTFTASFTNTYDPSEASIILRAVKTLIGGTLKESQFSVNVTEYTDGTYTETADVDSDGNTTITRSNGANGYMGYEIVYDQDHAGFGDEDCIVNESSVTTTTDATLGIKTETKTVTFSRTYYYTVTEVIPSGATVENNYTVDGMTYTTVTYYIKVTVSVDAEANRTSSDGGTTWVDWTYEQDGDVYISDAVYSTDKTNWENLYETITDESTGDTTTTIAILDFTNTYEAEGTGSISTYKILYGRSFVEDETLTFTITLLDRDAPILVDENGDKLDYETVTDESSGISYKVYTVTVTVDDISKVDTVTDSEGNVLYYVLKIDLATIYADEDDVGTWIYRVNETNASITNGMTLDSGEYGRLIIVTVTDNGNGSLDVSTSSTNNIDWNDDGEIDDTASVIANIFDPGNVTLYGTKTWVDGGAAHTAEENAQNVILTVYSSTDSGTSWTMLTDSYTLVWYDTLGIAHSQNVTYDADSGEWVIGDEDDYDSTSDSAYNLVWYENGDWHIRSLPQYNSASGDEIIYKVVETYVGDGSYTTTYSNDSEVYTEDYSSSDRFIITNTLEQEYVVLSGTKTWIDGDLQHDNDSEITLIVTRNSDSTTLTTLDQAEDTENGDFKEGKNGAYSYDDTGEYYYPDENGTYSPAADTCIVVWSGDTYSIYWYRYYDPNDGNADNDGFVYVGLEMYDSAGYEYIYVVAEQLDDNGQMTVTYDEDTDDEVTYTYTGTSTWGGDDDEYTYDFTNTMDSEEPTAGKTETSITYAADDENEEKTIDASEDGTEAKVNGRNVTQYAEVSVGDTITYTISYYNGYNTESQITITDVLDSGVEFKKATNPDGWTGDQTWTVANGIVTWSFTAQPFESGTVTLTVVVTEAAKTIYSTETTATVDNQATVVIAGNSIDTDIVINPLEDEEQTDPTKELTSVTTYDEDGEAVTRDEDDIDDYNNVYISVGDIIRYRIGYENASNTTKTIYIIDTLDEGVDYYGASHSGVYYPDGITLIIDGTEVPVPESSVVWTMTVQPYGSGSVYLYVQVNEFAKNATQTYTAVDPETGETYTAYTYTTTASIANQAYTYVGNTEAIYTNVVENPLGKDDLVDPTKTISENSPSGYTDDPTSVYDEETDVTTVTYDSVGVGSTIEYVISYYNNNNTEATVVIEDVLDEGVTFISASDGGTVSDEKTASVTDEDGVTSTYKYGGTVKWTLEVQPLTEGTVILVVQVNENALTTGEDEDTATVVNQATVTVGEVSNDTEIVVNPIDPDDPGDPEKVVSADSEAGVNGANVAVGDQITYTISYYNHTNTAAKVTIVDELDDGVDFVSATESTEDGISYSYDKTTHTVTWTIGSVAAFTGGTVDLTVEVNSSAETQVENDAVVTVGDNEATTNLVTNPVDDDPEDPTKTETAINGGAVDAVSTDSETGTITYEAVSVGDEITYTITYYNYYGTEADITITDQLDPGVEFVSATDKDGNTLTADDVFADEDDTYVKWPVFTAAAYESGSVTLTVRVTEDARTAGDGLSSGWADSATVDNQAIVQIGSDSAVSTNIVTNPLEPDDSTEPEKTVDVGDGTEIAVGDTLVYTISYYNNLSTAATVVIEDELDEGVDFVEASDNGVYDADTHTVTWTIEDVGAFTEGYVTLTVEVNEDARVAEDSDIADVVNAADVTVGSQATQTTNLVENPLTPDDPTDPAKSVDVGDGTEVSIGDKLVYTISYYNNLNTSATVTVTDTLEEGLTFVSASDGGKYDKSTRTVTWTIEDVGAFTEGSVTLKVKVNSDAGTSVKNTAEVSIGEESAVSTNTVTNPLETSVIKVKTGDNSRLLLWIFLLIASTAGLGSMAIYEKKRRRARNRK